MKRGRISIAPWKDSFGSEADHYGEALKWRGPGSDRVCCLSGSCNCSPCFHRGSLPMLTSQERLIPQCDQWLMMENGQLKLKNAKISLTGSVLYTKKCAGSAIDSAHSYYISLLYHHGQRRGESNDTRRVMRLHRGAGTHQTPAERHAAGPMLYSGRREHLNDNQRLLGFPL